MFCIFHCYSFRIYLLLRPMAAFLPGALWPPPPLGFLPTALRLPLPPPFLFFFPFLPPSGLASRLKVFQKKKQLCKYFANFH